MLWCQFSGYYVCPVLFSVPKFTEIILISCNGPQGKLTGYIFIKILGEQRKIY